MKTRSMLVLPFILSMVVLVAISCGSGGGGGNQAPGEPLPPVIKSTTVSVDAVLPPAVSGSIDQIYTPLSKGVAGQTIEVGVQGGSAIVFALDADDEIILASFGGSANTTLSADSTAKVLIKMAVGPLPAGVGEADFIQMAASTAGYGALVASIDDGLAAGLPPATSTQVISNVVTVTNQLAPLLASFTTALKGEPLNLTRDATTPLPYTIVDVAGSVGLHLGIKDSDLSSIKVVNGLPISWTVTGGDGVDMLLKGNSVSSVLLGNVSDWLGVAPMSVPTGGKSFDLVVKQTKASKIDTVADMTSAITVASLGLIPVSCTEEEVKTIIEPILSANLAVPTWPVIQNYISSPQFFSSVMPKVVVGCATGTLETKMLKSVEEAITTINAEAAQPTLPKRSKGFSFAALKVMLRLYEAFQTLNAGVSIGTQYALAREFFDSPPQTIGVCISSSGVANCAASMTYTPSSIYTIVGGKPKATLEARDAANNPTLVPAYLQYTQNDGGAVLTLDTFTGGTTAKDLGVASITATDPSSGVNASYSVAVVDPVVSPAAISINIGEKVSLSLQEIGGNPVTLEGALANWYVDLATTEAVRINTLQIPSVPSVIEIEGIAEGVSDVVFYNQMSQKSVKATVSVVPAVGTRATIASIIMAAPLCDNPAKIEVTLTDGVETITHLETTGSTDPCFETARGSIRYINGNMLLDLKIGTTYDVTVFTEGTFTDVPGPVWIASFVQGNITDLAVYDSNNTRVPDETCYLLTTSNTAKFKILAK